ncbi:MAG: hypothetical protein LBC10_05135 [Deltaproteobacteria bacterium]|nr:hypothetical protein [Deltaproteobacteria bacterium]
MFYCVLRRGDAMLKAMREEHAQFRVLLQALSARLDAGSGFREDRYGGYGEGSRESAPISVGEALDAYARKERLDLDGTRESDKGGLPDLKF